MAKFWDKYKNKIATLGAVGVMTTANPNQALAQESSNAEGANEIKTTIIQDEKKSDGVKIDSVKFKDLADMYYGAGLSREMAEEAAKRELLREAEKAMIPEKIAKNFNADSLSQESLECLTNAYNMQNDRVWTRPENDDEKIVPLNFHGIPLTVRADDTEVKEINLGQIAFINGEISMARYMMGEKTVSIDDELKTSHFENVDTKPIAVDTVQMPAEKPYRVGSYVPSEHQISMNYFKFDEIDNKIAETQDSVKMNPNNASWQSKLDSLNLRRARGEERNNPESLNYRGTLAHESEHANNHQVYKKQKTCVNTAENAQRFSVDEVAAQVADLDFLTDEYLKIKAQNGDLTEVFSNFESSGCDDYYSKIKNGEIVANDDEAKKQMIAGAIDEWGQRRSPLYEDTFSNAQFAAMTSSVPALITNNPNDLQDAKQGIFADINGKDFSHLIPQDFSVAMAESLNNKILESNKELLCLTPEIINEVSSKVDAELAKTGLSKEEYFAKFLQEGVFGQEKSLEQEKTADKEKVEKTVDNESKEGAGNSAKSQSDILRQLRGTSPNTSSSNDAKDNADIMQENIGGKGVIKKLRGVGKEGETKAFVGGANKLPENGIEK